MPPPRSFGRTRLQVDLHPPGSRLEAGVRPLGGSRDRPGSGGEGPSRRCYGISLGGVNFTRTVTVSLGAAILRPVAHPSPPTVTTLQPTLVHRPFHHEGWVYEE